MFGLFKVASFTDPVLGALARSRGYWRGALQLESGRRFQQGDFIERCGSVLPRMTMSLRLIALTSLLAIGGLAHAAVPTIVLPDGKTVHLQEATLRGIPVQSVAATAHGKSACYDGYDLVEVLKAAGVSPVESLRGKDLRLAVRVVAADGYEAIFALSELDPTLGNRQVVLVDRENGAPLPPTDGPWRLVVPKDGRPARWVRQVVSIVVFTP